MQTESPRVGDGMVVSLAYTLMVDGEEVAKATAAEPLEYLHGANEILPGLESSLEGKKVGERVDLTLAPDDAYGTYDPENIEVVDRADIPDADQFEIGMVVEVEDEDGFSYMAHVKQMSADTVELDFNPPLAGKTLNYIVDVIGVRPATEEELMHGHAHGADWSEEDEEDWEEFDDDVEDDEFEDDEQ